MVKLVMIQSELNLSQNIGNPRLVDTPACPVAMPVRNSEHIESRTIRELVDLLQASDYTSIIRRSGLI